VLLCLLSRTRPLNLYLRRYCFLFIYLFRRPPQTTTNQYDRKKTRVRLWLYEDTRLQIEGQIIGFDEYMNMVVDDAVEIDLSKKKRQEVGRILLKGDSITLMQEAQPVDSRTNEE